MASTNLILAKPGVDSTVTHQLPVNESATLQFSPDAISGLKLDGQGGLVISFVEGGHVKLSNFQSFIDNGNTLSLADGTKVDPKLLFDALGGDANNNPFLAADATQIGIPAAGATQEITLEKGQKYVLNFDLSETQSADVQDGDMVIAFANGGKVVLNDYQTAISGDMPAELSIVSKTCIVTADQLITDIQRLAAAGAIPPTAVVLEEEVVIEEETTRRSEVADATLQGGDDIGANDETALGYNAPDIEPAAGDEETKLAEAQAREVADIEPAAGEPGGDAVNRNRFWDSPGSAPFTGGEDIGAIDPTALGYQRPTPQENVIITVDRPNTGPIAIGPNTRYVDETNLANGTVVESGKININFGADGPGGISPNGVFQSSGSKTGGVLSHNGEPVIVDVVGNNYVGKTASGITVFELKIDVLTGDYTFNLYEELDHANGADPNDQIGLTFGIIARDGDGDSVQTTVTIVVADDAPTITGAEKTVDESDLGPLVVSGNLTHSFGQDGPGSIQANGTFSFAGSTKDGKLSSDGHEISITKTAGGYEGIANGQVIFTLEINATGGYTYTQYGNLDHNDPNDPNDIITLKFSVKITDGDTDTTDANIIINVKDDAPRFEDCGCPSVPSPGHAVEIVDETNLVNGVLTETGTINVNFGADAPGTFSVKTDGFTSGGSLKNGALTHNGVPVLVTVENGQFVGKAGNVVVFTFSINTTTGAYEFKLFDNLDHADPNDPNDAITLKFDILASDSEGDTIEGSVTVTVLDDAPTANDDVNDFTGAVANGNVITGENGGPGAADNLSQDDGNRVTKIAFGTTEVDVPATGTVSIDGDHGTLTISADGTYTYVPFGGTGSGGGTGTGEKVFAGGPALPDFEYAPLDPAEQTAKGIAPGNLDVNGGDTIQLNFVKENATNHNVIGVFTTDAAGNITIGKVLTANTETAGMDTVHYTVPGGATKAGFFLMSGWGGTDPVFSSLDFSTGALKLVVGYGTAGERPATINDNAADVKMVFTSAGGVETVINKDLYFSSERGGSSSLNPNDEVRVVSGSPDGDNTVLRIGFEDGKVSDLDYNDAIFDVTILQCGGNGGDPGCGCGGKTFKDEFVYTLTDGDGDKDQATLTLTGKDLTDDQPIFTAPGMEIVDETNLAGGIITETGTINVNFGADGPGHVGAAGTFISTGSKLNNALTSNGVAVVVTLTGGVYTGKAGNTTVFTMKINPDGSYEFKLYENLDHADGTDPNDAIDLNFGIIATDCDGDTAKTTLTVRVLDDAPVANDDIVNVDENGTATGNVTTNDVAGQDTPAIVTQITYKGTVYTLPTDGTSITINGDHGTLTINNTGSYTYVAKSVDSNKTDVYTYTYKDRDGDTDTADLTINVKNKNDTPDIIKPADEILDETNLVGGTLTETGAVTADFKGDGPGTFSATGVGSFSSSGSQLNNALTHNGVPVQVTLNGNTYEGKAGAKTIFTLTVNADGSYEFKLYDNLDHADGSNPNDVINLTFGITATDKDGDLANTTLTVKILDDAPTISGSSGTVDETNLRNGPLAVNGSLAHNFGQDGAGTLVEGNPANFVAGGSLKNGALTTNGVAVVVSLEGGQYVGKAGGVVVFTLDIKADGSYEYRQYKNLDHADNTNANDEITLKFDAKIVDFDGDSETAPIVITVRDDAPTFPPENPDNPPEDPENPPPGNPNDPDMGNGYRIVDETNLKDGNIVTTGNLNANFGADAPGSYGFTPGSFQSHGSKTGGNLTSNGVPVVVTLENGQFVGKAGGVVVFTLALNTTTGAYTFTLHEQLDHADGTNPNDVINLVFGVEAKDSEGDSASGTIRIDVRDDAPVANDDIVDVNENSVATGNVTGNDVPGQDTPGVVTQIVYKGQTYAVPQDGGALTINADYGTLTIFKTGAYTYVAKSVTADRYDEFTYTLKDHDGDKDTAKLEICVRNGNDIPVIIKPADEILDETNLAGGTLTETGTVQANFFGDGPGTFSAVQNSFSSSGSKTAGNLTSNGEAVTVTLTGNTFTGTADGKTIFTLTVNASGSYEFKLYEHLDHANGSDPNDIINLHFGIAATDSNGDSVSTTLTVKILDDAPVANDDIVTINENSVGTGNVTNNDSAGQDAPAVVTQVSFKGTIFTVPADGSNVTIVGDFGTLRINKTGAYTYTANSVTSDKFDTFVYTLKDHDGDIDTAKLEICVKNTNETPDIVKPADEIVDETNLSSGVITETGSVTADFKGDGPGVFGATGVFSSDGSRLGNKLTHNGTDVTVTTSGNTYTGKAGTKTVFTLTVNADGSYEFKLHEQLDHNDGSNPDDIIRLNFGIKATDKDGDSVSTTLTVQVKDDAPFAKDDHCTILISHGTFSSNVLTNDTAGQDAPIRVTQVKFGNTVLNVPATGVVTIAGLYGTLTIAADGTYTYKITNANAPTTVEQFQIVVRDFDGDTSTSTLHMSLVGDDLSGSQGNDTIYGSSGDDVIYGNGGSDMLYGMEGNDTIYGGDDWDTIYGGNGNDKIYGGNGNDLLVGGPGNDEIYGGEGDDTIYGDAGSTAAYAGNDRLFGGNGNDTIYGGGGDDYIEGGAGNDNLYGGDGNDTIYGGTGNDHIIGGKGNDTLYGGAGADTFWYLASNEGVDTIKDFKISEGDKLELSNVISNFDPVTNAINDFVFAQHSGGNTTILVNNNGTGLAGATALVVLEGVNVSVADLFNNGSILH